MAIDVIHHRPQPVLPQAPALPDLELQFEGLQGVRDELADLLTDPFFEPLRAGIDAQLARIYRAIQAEHPWPRVLSWPAGQTRVGLVAADVPPGLTDADVFAMLQPEFDAPAGAGDDVEAYRG
jgi:hypothetical protein